MNEDARSIGHPQRPAYYDEVIGTACLTPGCEALEVPASLVEPEKIETPVDKVALARAEWQDFKTSDSVRALKLFAERHADTPYAALALDKIAALEEASAPVEETPQAPVRSNHQRPGWCPNAGTRTEQAICADATLSALDLQMESLYKSTLSSRSGGARQAVQQRQRNWLVQRNSCGGDVGCLRSAYEFQLNALLQGG